LSDYPSYSPNSALFSNSEELMEGVKMWLTSLTQVHQKLIPQFAGIVAVIT
jgi:hypothetical protein